MIKSIKKATDILYRLAENPEIPVRPGRLAKDLGINVSTCVHILQTLCDSLLVEHVSRKDGYRLGPGTYMLSRHGHYQESLVKICVPVLRWLSRHLDSTVFLSVVCDGVKYLNYHIDVDGHVDFPSTQIVQGSVENSASGILMMAYMDFDSLNRVAYRSKTSTNRITKESEIKRKQIRENAYAEYHDKSGMHSFAFAIFDAGESPIASVGILYADTIDSKKFRKRVITYGKYSAEEINRRLIFSRSNPST